MTALAWYAYAMCRIWPDPTYPAHGFAVGATIALILYAAMRMVFSYFSINGSHIAAILILFSLYEAVWGYCQLFTGASRHHLYPVTGTFFNPGPYSAGLAMGIAMTLALRKNIHRIRYFKFTTSVRLGNETVDWIAMAIVTTLAIPMAMTLSRASFLALVVSLLLLYRERLRGWRRWIVIISVMAACGAALYLLKQGSADGRAIINYIGIRSIGKSPVIGHGVGSFLHRFAEETARISVMSPGIDLSRVDAMDYAFNDFLLVGVEQGVVGIAFALLLTILVLRRLWGNNEALFSGMVTLLVFSLFSYPFELLPFQIMATTIVAYAGTRSHNPKSEGVAIIKRKWGGKNIIYGMTGVAAICLVSVIIFKDISQREAAEREYRMLSGLRDSAFIEDYYALLPYLQENKRYLFDFARLLSDAGRHNDSNEMLRRGMLISNDPMFVVLQGNNYRDMRAYEEAEKAYLHAWHTMPNRLYPLYRLMKLQEMRGETSKALEYAIKVKGFREKIPSPAVNDMKQEANQIISSCRSDNSVTHTISKIR